MSFVVAAALAAGLLVVVPLAAHLLRRGRAVERPFPPAKLVARAAPVAQQRSKLEDRVLLLVRALLIATLALLGATPLVRCSRLTIERTAGASVALALVVDDSLSMQAREAGEPARFEQARRGALELVASARAGDSIAVVLAGKPARLALAATTDFAVVRRTLEQLQPSDSGTALEAALAVAQSALRELPQLDKRVAVFSDFAAPALSPLGEGQRLTAPLPALAHPYADCGVITAERRERQIEVRLACNGREAARGRQVQLRLGRQTLASVALQEQEGEQRVTLALTEPTAEQLDVRLTGTDAIAGDDWAPVSAAPAELVVGVVVDAAEASVMTGGPTVLEQALHALTEELEVRPLELLPEALAELRRFGALILDDPGGLPPASRAALSAYLERGGVVLALLGPRVEDVQLGSTLEPLLVGKASYGEHPAQGVDVGSVSWLGPEGSSLGELHAARRVNLDSGLPAGATLLARWSDGAPFAWQLGVGRGQALVLTLPVSVGESDLALRPGFLALLDEVLRRARRSGGAARLTVGEGSWFVPPGAALSSPEGSPAFAPGETQLSPRRLGRYTITAADQPFEAVASVEPAELTTLPIPPPSTVAATSSGEPPLLDLTPELVGLLLLLLGVELGLRAWAHWRPRQRRRGDPARRLRWQGQR